jgi:rfaE bifunctional protein nucleotidyltransferase chain/domain
MLSMSQILQAKLKTVTEMSLLARQFRSAGRKLVFANGCFDLIHVGHVRYLQGARAEGDVLVVGINSDASVKAIKGDGRPIMPALERAEIIASLESVDYVLIFDAPTVDGLLLDLKPDVHAKGTDYTAASVPERDTVASVGGRVAIVGDPKNHSTRDLIRLLASKLDKCPHHKKY